MAHPSTPSIPDKCPRCENSPLQPIVFLDGEWACPQCNLHSNDLEHDELRKARRRSDLRNKLMIAQIKVKALAKATDDENESAEKRADSRDLLRLWSFAEDYLQQRVDLPFLKDEYERIVKRVRRANPGVSEEQWFFTNPELQRAEEAFSGAESTIKTFHRWLPRWNDLYRSRMNGTEEDSSSKSAEPTVEGDPRQKPTKRKRHAGKRLPTELPKDAHMKSTEMQLLGKVILKNHPVLNDKAVELFKVEHPGVKLPENKNTLPNLINRTRDWIGLRGQTIQPRKK